MAIPPHKVTGMQAAAILKDTDLKVFIDTIFGESIQLTKWQAEKFLKSLGEKKVEIYPIEGSGVLITKPLRQR